MVRIHPVRARPGRVTAGRSQSLLASVVIFTLGVGLLAVPSATARALSTSETSNQATITDDDGWDALQAILDWLTQFISMSTVTPDDDASPDDQVSAVVAVYSTFGMPTLTQGTCTTLTEKLSEAEQIVHGGPAGLSADGAAALLNLTAQIRQDAVVQPSSD